MVVDLTIYVLDEYTRDGIFCPWCQAPTATAVPWVTVDTRTLLILGRGEARTCNSCGSDWLG